MTDATAVSAEAGSTATAATGATDQGSTGGAVDPLAGLETGSREWAEKNGVKDFASAVKTAREAQSLIGRSVQLPGQDGKPEDWDKAITAFTSKLPADRKAPADADGYEFKLPKGVPKDMPYDAEFAKGFKAEAHKLGLSAKQAAAIHDFYVSSAAGAFSKATEAAGAERQASDKALADQVIGATAALEKEFGARDSDGFKKAVENIERTIKNLGGDGLWNELVEMKVIDTSGLILKPTFAIAMHKASALFKEDGLETGAGAGSGENPFTGTNMTDQMRAIKADRAGALRMIAAAGKKPSDFGLSE